ncbi:uncharacterized protein N7483_003013 [Penicillium malachiteum]|uniref:uncharacterized protein n=1 Tax=Penicillium malachiteum TaxID=1324776 RepID=UPI0025476BB6|nr:uncharacterized protein N7483_003013 [Penicillium malachiteum]KAJ5737888.1 hypothetical protein N7483_003013 [Penicillium malachiteum]
MTAKEWTSLPSNFRPLSDSEHSQNQKRGQLLDSFLEGPLFVPPLSSLLIVDIPYGRIFSVDIATTEWSLVVQYDGEPNGLAWHAITQKVIIADFKMGILSLDPRDNSIKTIVDRYHGERLKGPNDI